VAGLLSGAALGLGFHRPDWLGGYASHRRRLYRLAHISLFGLALLNALGFFTVRLALTITPAVMVAGWALIAGALTMPVGCVVLAHRPNWPPVLLFAVPVGSLFVAGVVLAGKVAGL
jgi:hypothetical protein